MWLVERRCDFSTNRTARSACDSCWNRTPVNQSDCRKHHWFQNEYNKVCNSLNRCLWIFR
jgi:hypothetical protein